MSKPILISGVQPDGRLHLGNYLGAIKNFVRLQNSGKYECYFFIADYHSLTVNFDPKQKQKDIYHVLQAYLAAGINPRRSIIFQQSQVPECTELAWALSSLTTPSELERMTQYKDKTSRTSVDSLINTGLLTYPILMAADILLYNAKFVPVGHDQLQHLEFTRTLARKFNKKFGKTFIEPKALLTKAPRIMSLDDPTKKMSKSRPKTCLFLNDLPKDIKNKMMRAITDSGNEIKYDAKNKAGISNLLNIYSALSGRTIASLEKKYEGRGYAQFKSDLAKLITKKLAPFRSFHATNNTLHIFLDSGSRKTKKVAAQKIKEIKEKLGLIKKLPSNSK